MGLFLAKPAGLSPSSGAQAPTTSPVFGGKGKGGMWWKMVARYFLEHFSSQTLNLKEI